jgi:hypothetical protein
LPSIYSLLRAGAEREIAIEVLTQLDGRRALALHLLLQRGQRTLQVDSTAGRARLVLLDGAERRLRRRVRLADAAQDLLALGQVVAQLHNLALGHEQTLQVLELLQLAAPVLQTLIRLGLLLLLAHEGLLGGQSLLLLVVVDLLLLRPLLLGLQLVVLLLELLRARDLLKDRRQLLWRLCSQLRHVALEDEEARVRLGQDAEGLELLAVRLPPYHLAVDPVLAHAGRGDAAGEAGLVALHFTHQGHRGAATGCEFGVDGRVEDIGVGWRWAWSERARASAGGELGGKLRTDVLVGARLEDEVLQLLAAEILGLEPDHKRDGVHQIRLACAARAVARPVSGRVCELCMARWAVHLRRLAR